MGFGTAVDLGTTPPTCVTLGADATCKKRSYRQEMVAPEAFGPLGLHGQTKPIRIKHILSASGDGNATKNSTEAGTSEATAIIDKFNGGDKTGEQYDIWSVECHWFTAVGA